MINIYAVTHTQSVHHVEKLGGGWYDTSLRENGRIQAGKIGKFLVTQIKDNDVQIYSSDLKRAVETAEIINNTFSSTVILEPELREMSFGEAGGKTKEWQNNNVKPQPDKGNRLDHKLYNKAETRRDVGNRITNVINRIIASNNGEDIIIVTYGFAMTFIIMAWMKVPVENMDYCKFTLYSGSITKFCQDDFFSNRSMEYLNKIIYQNGQ